MSTNPPEGRKPLGMNRPRPAYMRAMQELRRSSAAQRHRDRSKYQRPQQARYDGSHE